MSGGQVSSELVWLIDIVATCADVLNIQLPAVSAEDSISFYPLLKHPEASGDRVTIIHHAYDGMYVVRKGEWKYVEGLGSGGFSEPRRYSAAKGEAGGQLYHIADDSRETLNLWLTRQDKV